MLQRAPLVAKRSVPHVMAPCFFCQVALFHAPKLKIAARRSALPRNRQLHHVSRRRLFRRRASFDVKNPVDTASQPARRGVENSPEELTSKAFQEARNQGIISIDGRKAYQLVQAMGALVARNELSGALFRKTCASFGISIDDAATVGRLLLRFKPTFDHALGRNMLLCASALGSEAATLLLLKKALDHDISTRDNPKQLELDALRSSHAHLQEMVKQRPANVPALVLQGQLHEHAHRNEEAKTMYEEAICAATVDTNPKMTILERLKRLIGASKSDTDESLPIPKLRAPAEYLDLGVARAHIRLAEVLGAVCEETSRRNLEIAAFQYEESVAYQLLAVKHMNRAKAIPSGIDPEDDPIGEAWLCNVPYEWYTCTLKAAANGHPPSCLLLGAWFTYYEAFGAGAFSDPVARSFLEQNVLVKRRRRYLYKCPPIPLSGTSLAREPASRKLFKVQTRYENIYTLAELWTNVGKDLGFERALVLSLMLAWERSRSSEMDKDIMIDILAIQRTPDACARAFAERLVDWIRRKHHRRLLATGLDMWK